MVVILNGERLEPPLSDMAAVAIAAVIASGVAHEQRLHPAAQVAVGSGADRQVEEVGHRAVPEDIHGEPVAGVDDGLDEGVIVPGLTEDGNAAVAAVEDVVLHSANGSPGSSRHAIMVKQGGLAVDIGYVPIFGLGRPIGVAEPMIAAIALRHGLELVTGTTAHFQRIQQLGYSITLVS